MLGHGPGDLDAQDAGGNLALGAREGIQTADEDGPAKSGCKTMLRQQDWAHAAPAPECANLSRLRRDVPNESGSSGVGGLK